MSKDPKLLEEVANSLTGRSAIVVGNGESRQSFDLGGLPENMKVFGCNALYREFTPDYLGAVDVLMTREIVKGGSLTFTFVGSEGRVQQWVEAGNDAAHAIITELARGWTTGPMMVRAAAVLGCNPIYLIGFDLGWTPNDGRINSFNSMYKDTPLYPTSDSLPCYHIRNWPQQLGSIFADFAVREFLQIGPNTLSIPTAEWGDLR